MAFQLRLALFLALALLCGFGGGNFASSMSNISFFFPKAEKGNALALNAGLGNLGVSVVQFVVPLAITAGVFGWLGGDPQISREASRTANLWLQNAGFVWVPFIAASAFAAWFGMNDIAAAKASFTEQSIIFQRRHNWIMCWLYTGTFGSFIGYSAGFPLLAKTQFPEINALQYAFLGPLVGALSRSLTGWVADRWGGARVTLWVFVVMAFGAAGVIYFLGERNFAGFFAMFLLLFFAAGVGNASTFQMIPNIMRKEMDRLMPEADAAAQRPHRCRLQFAEEQFSMLLDVTAVDHLRDVERISIDGVEPERFEVVVNLMSHPRVLRQRIIVEVPESDPSVPSLTGVFAGAAFPEREVYDLRSDPLELQNLATTASPAQLGCFHDWLETLRGCAGPGCRFRPCGLRRGRDHRTRGRCRTRCDRAIRNRAMPADSGRCSRSRLRLPSSPPSP